MKNNIFKNWVFKKGKIAPSLFSLTFLLFLLVPFSGKAQEVEAAVDTTSIRIGEQITYNISVEGDASDMVVFPEGQTFSPLEMIESFAIDTSKISDRIVRLNKEYALTQFDSGSYVIPQQRVIINEQSFLTDSILIEVADVVVDTTKQKMYPIKPSVEVPPGFTIPVWLWWLLGLLVLAGVAFWFFRRRKKKKAEAQKLPPYEQALFELRQLDDSHLLEQREIKEYYSQLSAAVRRYLDDEIYDHALESTTGELIAYLETQRDLGKLKLENTTIARLKVILERADLAKFANSRPDVLTAKEDRSSVENVINDTKASIPQPSEEDLLRDQEYSARIERKKKVKKIVTAVVVVVLLISAATAYIISTHGLTYFTDTYIGNKSKDMLEGEWIRSEYGSLPPVTITTPDVLVRDLSDTTGITAGKQSFKLGKLEANLFVSLNTRPAGEDFDIQSAVEEVYTYLEKRGARNIITKQEEFSTLNGIEGLRIFGSMTLENENTKNTLQKEYSILNFALGGRYQQIVVIYDENDTYADEIAQRITTSVELVNQEN